MRKIFVLLAVLAVCMACSDNNEKDPLDGEGDDGNPEAGSGEAAIAMVTEMKDIDLFIGTFREGEAVTVDWGDGTKEEVKSGVNEEADDGVLYEAYLKHVYSSQKPHTIGVNGKIRTLNCYDAGLTALDVSKCPALEGIGCGKNKLTALELSKNTALLWLGCGYNQLTAMDISKNTALKILECDYNRLTALKVSRCTVLVNLSCGYNQLTVLDVSKNTALTELWCSGNNLSALDVSRNTALTQLDCGNNNFSVDAMNAIYNALPVVRYGQLRCNKIGDYYIAENKGWRVE